MFPRRANMSEVCFCAEQDKSTNFINSNPFPLDTLTVPGLTAQVTATVERAVSVLEKAPAAG